nr:hypothetical protein [Pedobacter sp. ASV19]
MKDKVLLKLSSVRIVVSVIKTRHMETQDNQKQENGSEERIILNDDVKFENESVDPGFEQSKDAELKKQISTNSAKGGESEPDEKLEDQDAESDNGSEDDAMNYKNDRDNGAYNPKNI